MPIRNNYAITLQIFFQLICNNNHHNKYNLLPLAANDQPNMCYTRMLSKPLVDEIVTILSLSRNVVLDICYYVPVAPGFLFFK